MWFWTRRFGEHRPGRAAWMAAVLAPAMSVPAGELPTEPVLPLELANRAVLAAVRQCKEDGFRVSAAVVDAAGVLRAQARADGAGPHTIDSSRRKAYTSASLREPTARLAGLIAGRPQIQALREMNESILILGGGLPVRMDGSVVAGIGVGGAPGAHLDESCARAGLKAIGADLYENTSGE